jgi:hypothetical protein
VEGSDALKTGDKGAEKQQELDGDVEMKEGEVRSSFSLSLESMLTLSYRTSPHALKIQARRKLRPPLPLRRSSLAPRLRFRLSTRHGLRKKLSSPEVVEDSWRAGELAAGSTRTSVAMREPSAPRRSRMGALGL